MYVAPAYFSPSSLDTFNQCPQRFFYSRIQGQPTFDTEHTIRGNFVHEILECLFKVEPKKRTVQLAKELARILWDENWRVKTEALGFSEKELKEFRWSAWWCVRNYFDMENPEEVDPQGLEVRVEGTIEGVPFYGIVDRWSYDENGEIVITDYKTGRVPKPQYAGPKKLQLYIYANLLEKSEGKDCSVMQLYYVKEGEVVEYEPDEKLRSEAADTFARSWDDMQTACDNGHFPTNTGPLCNWCDFRDICPAFN